MVHIFTLDILNIVFCSLIHFNGGIILHSIVTFVHILVLSVDYLLRRWNLKKPRKVS